MNRRSFLLGAPAISAIIHQSSDQSTTTLATTQTLRDLRAAALYSRCVQYEIRRAVDDEIFTLGSWACGFIAHPASRSTYRKFPNLLDDGEATFLLPGLPELKATNVERTTELFGEDAIVCPVTDEHGSHGAFAICLNGVLVQLLCLEPGPGMESQESIEAVRTIASAIQERDSNFYGRGEMNRCILFDHVASFDDVREFFPQLRVREDHYLFTQDDGLSDFWE